MKPQNVVSYNSEDHKVKIRPSASTLYNHFGYDSDNSPYAGGSNYDSKRLLPEHLLFRDRDGVWTSPINPFISEDTLVGDSCDIKQSSYYEHCRSLLNCTVCLGNNHCSWCKTSNQCHPIIKEGCHCPEVCLHGIDPYRICHDYQPGTIVLGQVDNIAPGSRGTREAAFVPMKIVET